jgi:hypothetical protein
MLVDTRALGSVSADDDTWEPATEIPEDMVRRYERRKKLPDGLLTRAEPPVIDQRPFAYQNSLKGALSRLSSDGDWIARTKALRTLNEGSCSNVILSDRAGRWCIGNSMIWRNRIPFYVCFWHGFPGARLPPIQVYFRRLFNLAKYVF